MNPATLKLNPIPILVGLIGLVTAFVLGMFIGGGEVFNLALIGGAVILVLVIAGMREHIWLLIPMCWGLTGSVSILPVPFSVRDLVVMLVAAMAFALLALRIYRFRNRWRLIELVMFLNLGQVALVFTAHPTGLRALSSETVGARPYFNVVIAFVAYFILSNQVLSAKIARRLPVLVLIPEAITSLIVLLVRAKPTLGYVLGWFYTGFVPQVQFSEQAGGVERLNIGSGNTIMTVLCSYFRPLSLLSPAKPLRFLFFLIGLTLVLLSGFRSQLIGVAAIFIIASYFHNGKSEAFIVFAAMTFTVTVLILFNSAIHPLPLAMQRTLSFLPGNWDSRAKRDAENSTDWRLEMWKDIPKSSQYIRDRVMGDGFGFSRAELQAMERQRYRTGDISQEDFMIIGSFHNGPLSAIRFVGIVGMVLFYLLLIYSAVYAVRLIRAAEGSNFYPLTLFIGLPLIWEPFNYTLVFGAYDVALPIAIFGVGMLKMLENSLRHAKDKGRHKAQSVSTTPSRQLISAAR
jgi:O-antigen ligase/polysaccharide polymerase Wzy-like membrane protein